jgi:ATP-dependent Lhr-like helicase
MAQQVMALCLQERGVGRRDWPGWLRGEPAFSAMPEGRVREVLDWMLAEGILSDDEGILWLGRKGEEDFGRRNFLELFSVFTSPPLFAVRHGRQELGFVDQTTFLSRREGPQVLLLGGRPWRVTNLDWTRRIAHVEAAEEAGRSRWRGPGPLLGFPLCQAIRQLLAGGQVSPRWSRRAQDRMGELREEHFFVNAEGPTLLSRPSSALEWWTFAGTRANAVLAGEMARLGGRVEHDALAVTVEGTEGLSVVLAAVRELTTREPSSMAPAVDEAALEGLKFSECLPRALGLAVLAARMRDVAATRAILSQPMRDISGA